MPVLKKNPKGYFITLEGDDGAGKSTQASQISNILNAHNIEHIVTREPGGTDTAEKLRSFALDTRCHPMTQALLMIACRRDHWPDILKQQERGLWVISDRYKDSTIAYQGFGQGLKPHVLETLHKLVFGDQPNQGNPDLTLWLDLTPEEAAQRRHKRHKIEVTESPLQKWLRDTSDASDMEEILSFDLMDVEFHARVRRGYAYCLMRSPERIVRINGMLTPHEITNAVEGALSPWIDAWKKILQVEPV